MLQSFIKICISTVVFAFAMASCTELIDIKTTVSVANFSNSFKEYDYGRQMSFYWFAIRWYLEVDQKIDLSDYTAETYIIAIQNNRGGECRVYRVDESILVEKAKEIKNIVS